MLDMKLITRHVKAKKERRWSSGRVKDVFTPFLGGLRKNSDRKNQDGKRAVTEILWAAIDCDRQRG